MSTIVGLRSLSLPIPRVPIISGLNNRLIQSEFPLTRLSHCALVIFAILSGFVFPPLVGALWGDKLGAFIWGSLVARLMSESCSLVASSAHAKRLAADVNTL